MLMLSNEIRTVNKLNKRLKKLIKMIPKYLRDDFEEEAYIAGGSIYSTYNNMKVNDIDVFIRTEKLKSRLLRYFKELPDLKVKFGDGLTIYIGTFKGKKLVITNNAITIGKYQIVLKDIGEPEEVIGRFDFKHNMHWIENNEIKAVNNIYHLDSKVLQFNNLRARDIVSTIMRIPKFLNKGFELEDKELGLMLLQLNENGFSDDELNLLKHKPSSTHFGS